MPKTPFETAQMNAFDFGTKFLFNAACTETIKALEDMRLESSALLKDLKETDCLETKKAHRQAIKHNIQDRKFLLESLFMNPIESNA